MLGKKSVHWKNINDNVQNAFFATSTQAETKFPFKREGFTGLNLVFNSFTRHFGEHFGLAFIVYNSLFSFILRGVGGGGKGMKGKKVFLFD